MVKYSDADMVRGAKLMVENGFTVRKVADMIGVSKSTFHLWIQKELLEVDSFLYNEVEMVLRKNLAERHLRGGMSTKRMYESKKKAVAV